MKTNSFGLALVLGAVVLSTGCSTKNYGRQADLTDFEKNTMTCRELDLEQAKVQGFIQHVNRESNFDGRSVLSFLGDFGVGNIMEKDSAIESATKRMTELNSARMRQSCSYANASPPPAPAESSVAPSTSSSDTSIDEKVYELQQQTGLGYEEYVKRYKEITGQQ